MYPGSPANSLDLVILALLSLQDLSLEGSSLCWHCRLAMQASMTDQRGQIQDDVDDSHFTRLHMHGVMND